MKALVVIFLLLHLLQGSHSAAMSEAQLQNAVNLMKNVCQPKVKVSDKLINKMHNGEFVEDEALMCYYECIFKMGKLMINGKYDLESALTQVATLPEARQELITATLKNCKDKGQGSDKCANAFEVAKCFYLDNPENFFLP